MKCQILNKAVCFIIGHKFEFIKQSKTMNLWHVRCEKCNDEFIIEENSKWAVPVNDELLRAMNTDNQTVTEQCQCTPDIKH